MLEEKRNSELDALKGVAAILVVLGHIYETTTIGYENSFCFNIIWALQMPLFFFISGVIQKPCNSSQELRHILLNRARTCILPFIVYYFLFCTLMRGEHERNIMVAAENLLFNMQDSLWFLYVLFVLSITMGIASYLAHRITSKSVCVDFPQALTIVLFGIMLLPWVVLAKYVSLSFLFSKYLLYYSLLMALGAISRKFVLRVLPAYHNKNSVLYEITTCAITIGFIYIILNYKLFSIADNIMGIAIRLGAAFLGIFLIMIVVNGLSDGKIKCYLVIVGRNSIEVYVSHVMLLNVLVTMPYPIVTIEAAAMIVLKFVITSACMITMIALVKKNRVAELLLFGRWRVKND